MVRVKYSALAKLVALVVFILIVIPSFMKVFDNESTHPKDGEDELVNSVRREADSNHREVPRVDSNREYPNKDEVNFDPTYLKVLDKEDRIIVIL